MQISQRRIDRRRDATKENRGESRKYPTCARADLQALSERGKIVSFSFQKLLGMSRVNHDNELMRMLTALRAT